MLEMAQITIPFFFIGKSEKLRRKSQKTCIFTTLFNKFVISNVFDRFWATTASYFRFYIKKNGTVTLLKITSQVSQLKIDDEMPIWAHPDLKEHYAPPPSSIDPTRCLLICPILLINLHH